MSRPGFGPPQHAVLALPPEIAFLATQGFDAGLLAEAVDLGRKAGTDAATALLNNGLMAEDAYYRALARALGAPYLAGAIPLGADALYPDCLVAGVAPLAPGAPAAFVLAPRGPAVAELLRGRPGLGRPPALTSPRTLSAAMFAAHPDGIAAYAADTLQVRRPDWALKAGAMGPYLTIAGLIAGALILAAGLLPGDLVLGAWTILQIAFLGMVTFRIAAVSVEAEPVPPSPLSDAQLPVYTVLVALHREARVVPRLAAALSRFDYPVLCSNLTQKR